jgi:molybdopterin-synthase adenylyltransferase
MAFSRDETERYKRHILLKELGGPGQQRLKAATVAIVGMGGLGAPAALYLAAAGVGFLRLIDPDTVALSNLQRQVLYNTLDIGQEKVEAADYALNVLNPHVDVDPRVAKIDASNALHQLAGADVVLDGTDDFATRFAVNAACHQLRVPLVSGAVGRWDGQIGVFASGVTKGAPCYRCLVPETPPDVEPCAEAGIVGALTGVIGAMMALEAIKIIARAGSPLQGRLLIYDALAAQTRVVALPPDPACPVCGG